MSVHFNIGGVWKSMASVSVNIGGVWKTVTDIWCNIGGVWKYILKKASIQYYGTVSALNSARWYLAGAWVGSYGLFAGGYPGVSTVEAYNSSLVKSNPVALAADTQSPTAVSSPNYALFGGGYDTWNINAYSASLVRSTLTNWPQLVRMGCGGYIGGHYLLAGGFITRNSSYYSAVTQYNSSLAFVNYLGMSVGRSDFASVLVGNYLLFGGGKISSTANTAVVDAFNTSLVRTSPTSLSVARRGLAGAKTPNYGIFAGGGNTVDAYNASLVRSTPTVLSNTMYSLAGVDIGDFAVFAGGVQGQDGSSGGVVSTANAYDDNLVRSIPTSLSEGRFWLAATKAGDYGLFGGGLISGVTGSDNVDVYNAT